MPAVSTTGITELLNAWTNGDSSALEKLAPLILPDLHRIAKHHLDREHSGRIALLCGLSVREAAEVLHVAPNTVLRDWKLAKAWLWREIKGTKGHDARPVETN